MLNHIRLKHKEEFDRPETPEKQLTWSNFVNSLRKFVKTDDITRAIVDMVVFDYMPLQMVEGKGFKKLQKDQGFTVINVLVHIYLHFYRVPGYSIGKTSE